VVMLYMYLICFLRICLPFAYYCRASYISSILGVCNKKTHVCDVLDGWMKVVYVHLCIYVLCGGCSRVFARLLRWFLCTHQGKRYLTSHLTLCAHVCLFIYFGHTHNYTYVNTTTLGDIKTHSTSKPLHGNVKHYRKTQQSIY
jgi:hypothetical protein